ncbi:MAG: hypothetical protein IIY23_00600 [Erysipelotrichaceae bacterium]|nr:hypothetical protein [Erysipelotrichaceae bacterium]
MKKLFAVLAALLLVLTAAGCSQNATENFTFENMTITVPKSYKMKEVDYEGFDYTLEGEKLVIFFGRIPVADIEAYGLDEETVANMAYQGMDVKEKDGMTYGTYTYENGTDKFFYTYGLFKDDTYYWDVNVACDQADQEKLADQMITILQSVNLK